jgi:MFS family permease
VSGVVLPVFLQWLLNAYGFRTALRVWSVALFVLTAPLLSFVKPRLPIAQTASMRPFDFRFLWNRTFLIFQLGNILEALGFFLPSIYLPTYASRTLGVSNLVASLTVILVNLASVFGCIIMGTLVDRYHATTCIFISTVGSTIAVFLIWGFSLTLAPLYIFCVVYGMFAGSFSSTWPAIMKEVQKETNAVEPTIVFAFLAAGRGIGNVVSGPLSEKLLQGLAWRGVAGGAYGSGYGTLIVFTGVTAFLGGLSVLARPLRLL